MHDRIAELRGLQDELTNCENGPRKETRAAAAADVQVAIDRVRGELEGQAAALEEQAKELMGQGQDGAVGVATEEARTIRSALDPGQETAAESKPRRTARGK